ncbi:unnamed protein product [Nesidiocoris tenuis]|uniref:Uncharacterized protein n=1 Tax=Nesidiocoris tenuis TaxID=355587 RepID=A0A6H5HDE8_9HEMI|nr:unnamed protein product [Nesidiocoris tenuis]
MVSGVGAGVGRAVEGRSVSDSDRSVSDSWSVTGVRDGSVSDGDGSVSDSWSVTGVLDGGRSVDGLGDGDGRFGDHSLGHDGSGRSGTGFFADVGVESVDGVGGVVDDPEINDNLSIQRIYRAYEDFVSILFFSKIIEHFYLWILSI